ncbi:hypothetical protein QYS36_14410 [Pseudomonas sp. G34]|nr:hypothetical protein [Pseudomonas sp. G34]MDQ7986130.1 hypothetical protein [Pseudomonas sp. G34]
MKAAAATTGNDLLGHRARAFRPGAAQPLDVSMLSGGPLRFGL